MSPKHQYSLDLIEHQVEHSVVKQRKSDGYINATELCLAAKKPWHRYVMEESTGHFLRALASKSNLGVDQLTQQVVSPDGAACHWVHPKVAIHLGQWLSAEFAVQVADWVYNWMNTGGQATASALPPHLQRHVLNMGKIPFTHFSILQEMTNALIAPLMAQGYVLPEKLVPDISQGKMFCKFARDHLGLDTDALPTYQHEYVDGRVVPAKLYPVELLGEFRNYINRIWMPERSAKYFAERDPTALLALDKVLKISYQQPRAIAR